MVRRRPPDLGAAAIGQDLRGGVRSCGAGGGVAAFIPRLAFVPSNTGHTGSDPAAAAAFNCQTKALVCLDPSGRRPVDLLLNVDFKPGDIVAAALNRDRRHLLVDVRRKFGISEAGQVQECARADRLALLGFHPAGDGDGEPLPYEVPRGPTRSPRAIRLRDLTRHKLRVALVRVGRGDGA